MADKIPVKAYFAGSDVTALGEFEPGDTVPISQGGTASTTAAAARAALGVSWETISHVSVTAVGSVTVTLPTGYTTFRVHFVGVSCDTSNATNDLYLRAVQSGTLLTGALDYFDFGVDWTSAAGTITSSTKSHLPLTRGGMTLSEGISGFIELGAGSTSQRSQIAGIMRHTNNAASRTAHVVTSEILATNSRIEQLLFAFVGTGSFQAKGQIILEGLRT